MALNDNSSTNPTPVKKLTTAQRKALEFLSQVDHAWTSNKTGYGAHDRLVHRHSALILIELGYARRLPGSLTGQVAITPAGLAALGSAPTPAAPFLPTMSVIQQGQIRVYDETMTSGQPALTASDFDYDWRADMNVYPFDTQTAIPVPFKVGDRVVSIFNKPVVYATFMPDRYYDQPAPAAPPEPTGANRNSMLTKSEIEQVARIESWMDEVEPFDAIEEWPDALDHIRWLLNLVKSLPGAGGGGYGDDWRLAYDPLDAVQDTLRQQRDDGRYSAAEYERATASFELQVRACICDLDRYDIAAYWLEALADAASLAVQR